MRSGPNKGGQDAGYGVIAPSVQLRELDAFAAAKIRGFGALYSLLMTMVFNQYTVVGSKIAGGPPSEGGLGSTSPVVPSRTSRPDRGVLGVFFNREITVPFQNTRPGPLD